MSKQNGVAKPEVVVPHALEGAVSQTGCHPSVGWDLCLNRIWIPAYAGTASLRWDDKLLTLGRQRFYFKHKQLATTG